MDDATGKAFSCFWGCHPERHTADARHTFAFKYVRVFSCRNEVNVHSAYANACTHSVHGRIAVNVLIRLHMLINVCKNNLIALYTLAHSSTVTEWMNEWQIISWRFVQLKLMKIIIKCIIKWQVSVWHRNRNVKIKWFRANVSFILVVLVVFHIWMRRQSHSTARRMKNKIVTTCVHCAERTHSHRMSIVKFIYGMQSARSLTHTQTHPAVACRITLASSIDVYSI